MSFTGSGEVGREVMKAAAASNLKPVSLELGGKSPLIIFDDADIDMASEQALLGILYNKVRSIFVIFFNLFLLNIFLVLTNPCIFTFTLF